MSNIQVSLDGETIAAGKSATYIPWMFWHGIEQLAPGFDHSAVVDRLAAIRKSGGPGFELVGKSILFAPAFKVQIDDALIVAD